MAAGRAAAAVAWPLPVAAAAAQEKHADRERHGRGGGERRSARHAGRDRRAAPAAATPFDAAIAAAGVLGVVEPYSCGIGGGGFMVIRDGGTGEITTIDSRETAPAAMQPTAFFHRRRPPTDAQFTVNRYSGLSRRRARHAARRGSTSLRRLRHAARSSQALRHGARRRPQGLHRRPDLLRPDDAANAALLRRHPVDARRSTSTPTARRATSAPSSRNPDLARTLPAASAGSARPSGFYTRPGRRGDRQGRARSRRVAADRRPRPGGPA